MRKIVSIIVRIMLIVMVGKCGVIVMVNIPHIMVLVMKKSILTVLFLNVMVGITVMLLVLVLVIMVMLLMLVLVKPFG